MRNDYFYNHGNHDHITNIHIPHLTKISIGSLEYSWRISDNPDLILHEYHRVDKRKINKLQARNSTDHFNNNPGLIDRSCKIIRAHLDT